MSLMPLASLLVFLLLFSSIRLPICSNLIPNQQFYLKPFCLNQQQQLSSYTTVTTMQSSHARQGRQNQLYDNGARLVAGCVPVDKKGRRVLLVASSKNEGEWVLPKGGWENDETQEEAAARETWEEAGAIGRIVAHLGEFEHKINKRTGVPENIFIFFEMEVERIEERWPEMKKRERRWFSYEDARNIVSKKVMRKALEQCSLARG